MTPIEFAKGDPAILGSERSRLMVVEDDPITRSMLANYFAKEGFAVDEAGTTAECRTLLRVREPDLIFIDIELPDGNGIELAQEIRAITTAGIILVTQRDTEVDRVVGLELAADDYVTKPINLRELLARARALLRRRRQGAASTPPQATALTFGQWRLDLTRRELTTREGQPIQLTRGEFDLLAAIVQARGRPLGRDFLIGVVSNRTREVDSRTVDSLVVRLRRKLAASGATGQVLVTVTGVGYMLGMAVEQPL